LVIGTSDAKTGIIDTLCLFGITNTSNTTHNAHTRIDLTGSFVTEESTFAICFCTWIFCTGTILTNVSIETLDTSAGFYAIAFATEFTITTSDTLTWIITAHTLATDFSFGASGGVTVVFDTSPFNASKFGWACHLLASIETLASLANSTFGTGDGQTWIICTFPCSGITQTSDFTSDRCTFVFGTSSVRLTNFAIVTCHTTARISFTNTVDTALSSDTLHANTGSHTRATTTECTFFTHHTFTGIVCTSGLHTYFTVITSEVVTIIFDTLTPFTHFTSRTVGVFAKINTFALGTAQTLLTGHHCTRIVFTLTVDTNTTGWASHAFTWVRDTLPFVTNFASFTGHTSACIGFTQALHARSLPCTGHLVTRLDALSITTKLPIITLQTSTWVIDTCPLSTDFAAWTTESITISRRTLPLPTNKPRRTLQAVTNILTHTSLTELAARTSHIFTSCFSITTAITTDFAFGTLTIATEIGTDTILTSDAVRTLRAVIDISVTVVVQTITNLSRRLESLATCPLPTKTSIESRSTFPFTRADQVLICQAIAVVVFPITDLDLRHTATGTRSPLTVRTCLLTFSTSRRTRTFFAIFTGSTTVFVNLSIAVIVFLVVTDLFATRLDLTLTGRLPLTTHTSLRTGRTNPHTFRLRIACITRTNRTIFTVATVLINLSVTVVITTITHFCRRLGGCTARPFSGGTDLFTCTTCRFTRTL
tara:strand:- start:691 stop:2820 length:2130 start_codon:yes stop_codon:yes gene_type:complete